MYQCCYLLGCYRTPVVPPVSSSELSFIDWTVNRPMPKGEEQHTCGKLSGGFVASNGILTSPHGVTKYGISLLSSACHAHEPASLRLQSPKQASVMVRSAVSDVCLQQAALRQELLPH